MKYRLMKLVDGNWYEWGTFSDPVRLAYASFLLGQSGIDDIKVEEVE